MPPLGGGGCGEEAFHATGFAIFPAPQRAATWLFALAGGAAGTFPPQPLAAIGGAGEQGAAGTFPPQPSSAHLLANVTGFCAALRRREPPAHALARGTFTQSCSLSLASAETGMSMFFTSAMDATRHGQATATATEAVEAGAGGESSLSNSCNPSVTGTAIKARLTGHEESKPGILETSLLMLSWTILHTSSV